MRNIKATAAILLAMFLAACSSVEPPHDLQARAEANLDQARSSGADEYAPVVLRDAEKHMEMANQAMKQENYAEAKRYLEKAIADADLAIATANSERTVIAAQEIRQGLNALESEISP